MTAASLQTKWVDAFLRAATGLRSVEYALHSRAEMHPLICSCVSSRYVADSFPVDAETDLEAFSNDIVETAPGWGASLDVDSGTHGLYCDIFMSYRRSSLPIVLICNARIARYCAGWRSYVALQGC
jgi:hypothetical protein